MTNHIRLFFIDSGYCKTIKDITRGVFAVAEIEQFFFPYIALNYLPFREGAKGGIILVTRKYTIRKDYDFSEESVRADIDDMKKIIWDILKDLEDDQEINLRNIADKHGCLVNMKGYTTFGVIDSWKQKLNQLKNNVCCKFIVDNMSSSIVRHNILNDFLRLSHKDVQTRDICKKVRGQECADNFPPASANHAVCMSEVEQLCNVGYPVNKPVVCQAELVQKVRDDLMERLKKANFKVDKRFFDEIISSGMFSNLGERMRNATVNINNVRGALDDMFMEDGSYLKIMNYTNNIERFDGEENKENNMNYMWIF
ncbi:MAG: hypothetical protein MUO21_03430, partial [Nitrososphaeraceae archaeon]|nr:hypothetical protein [Nitrososphaeraceae archaeon]